MALRILLVDDSMMVRRIVSDIVQKIPGVVICGEAENGLAALDRIKTLNPDLVILDVEMPVMDGLTCLAEIRRAKIRIPVIMLSALTRHGARETFRALELGALDFVPKPLPSSGMGIEDVEFLLSQKIQDILQLEAVRKEPTKLFHSRSAETATHEILCLGSSTGGPTVLNKLFSEFGPGFPVPVLVVQHMPPVFTHAFAERLNQISTLKTTEAEDGMQIEKGCAYVAPGDWHMEAGEDGKIHLNRLERVNSHRPSIDVTLKSVVRVFGPRAVGVIMTGMGNDGVAGMKMLAEAGGMTLAQDEPSSVVFGMNRRAIEAGAIQKVASADDLPGVLNALFGVKA